MIPDEEEVQREKWQNLKNYFRRGGEVSSWSKRRRRLEVAAVRSCRDAVRAPLPLSLLHPTLLPKLPFGLNSRTYPQVLANLFLDVLYFVMCWPGPQTRGLKYWLKREKNIRVCCPKHTIDIMLSIFMFNILTALTTKKVTLRRVKIMKQVK